MQNLFLINIFFIALSAYKTIIVHKYEKILFDIKTNGNACACDMTDYLTAVENHKKRIHRELLLNKLISKIVEHLGRF